MPCSILKCVYGKLIIPQRYIICLFAFFGIVIAYTLRINLIIAITEMVIEKPLPDDSSTTSTPLTSPRPPEDTFRQMKAIQYNWEESEQEIILAAFFPGYIVSHFPGGFLADTYGAKHFLSAGIIISGVTSMFTPQIIEIGGWIALAISRFLIGVMQGALFPSVSSILARWVPKRERSRLGGLVMTGPQVGSILGYPLSGLLIGMAEWQTVFYFWGALSFVWYLLFLLFVYSEPKQHPFISPEEKAMLESEIAPIQKYKVPWMKIIFDSRCMAIIAGEIGHGVVFYFIATNLPKYMKDVLKFNIKENGFLNAFPYIAMWICAVIASVTADYCINNGIASIIFIRKLYTTIGSLFPSLCLLGAVYFGYNREGAVSMFILSMFFKGACYSGLRINVLDITKNFSGVLMAFSNGIGSVSYIPIPPMIAWIAKDNTIAQWTIVFWIIFAVASITNIIYVIWASGERAEWDFVDQ